MGGSTLSQSLAQPVTRILLVVLALVSVWGAQQIHVSGRRQFSDTFEFPWMMWSLQVALLIIAGLLVTLAGRRPTSSATSGWKEAVVIAVPPALLLAHHVLFQVYLAPHEIDLPGPLDQHHSLMQPGPQFVLAFIVGIGLAIGIRQSPAVPSDPARP